MGHLKFKSPKRLLLTILLAVGVFFGYQFITKKKSSTDSVQTTDISKKNTGTDSATMTKKDTTMHKPVVTPPTVVSKPNNVPVVVKPEEKKPTDVVISPKQPEKVVPVVKQPVTKTTTVVKKKPVVKKTEPKKKKDTRENLDIKF